MSPHFAEELRTVVRVAEPTLRGLSDSLVDARPAPDRWTIKEVLGHLIDSAANNHQRFVRAQFTTLLIFPKYEQNRWVESQRYCDTEWQELVVLWGAFNRHLAHVIQNIPQQSLSAECRIGDYDPMSLSFLIEDYIVHLKHHLKKIAERLDMEPSRLGI